MTDLFLHNRKLETVFDLLGKNENDLTYSLGWALSRSAAFLNDLMDDFFPAIDHGPAEEIRMQDHAEDGGFTDIEIAARSAHVIIEAKRGWNLPSDSQLEKYSPRLHSANAEWTAIVALSECSAEYASLRLPDSIQGIRVVHRSWRQIIGLVARSSLAAGQAEKRLLRELRQYLRSVTSMQEQTSNRVYVVSLSRHSDWSEIPPVDFVEKKHRYFHPYGKNWPKDPPNYLGFRYDGKLQSIHHVDDYEIVQDLRDRFPELRSGGDPHIVYHLGPAIRPDHEVRTGDVNRSARVWAAIDLLLTCDTISEARDKSKERMPEELI